jgi:hypothetical protein
MTEQPNTEVVETEPYAYLAKSGMIHTQPLCMNFKQIEKAVTPAQQAKVGAMKISLTDAFERVTKGAQHCGMCVKIAQQEAEKKAAESANIPGLPELTNGDVAVLESAKPEAKPAKAAKKAAAAKPEPKTETPAAEAKPAKPAKVEGKGNGKNAISLFEVFAKADADGKLPDGALSAYRLKVKAVLVATGGDLEKTDLTTIDVAATLTKFDAAKQELLESTRRSYKDAFKRAVRLFNDYVKDPASWNPTAPAVRSARPAAEGKAPTKAQVRNWAIEQGHVKKDELGPNYVPVKLYDLYNAAHASA